MSLFIQKYRSRMLLLSLLKTCNCADVLKGFCCSCLLKFESLKTSTEHRLYLCILYTTHVNDFVDVIDIHRCCSEHWLLCELPIKLWVWTCYWIFFVRHLRRGFVCVFMNVYGLSACYVLIWDQLTICMQAIVRLVYRWLVGPGFSLIVQLSNDDSLGYVQTTGLWKINTAKKEKKELTHNDHLFIHTDIYTQ